MTVRPCHFGPSTDFKFSGKYDIALAEVSKAIWRARDNYPIKALLTANASNGIRYVSRPLYVHQFKQEMIDSTLRSSIDAQLELAVMDAAGAGVFDPIDTLSYNLNLREMRDPGHQCPVCQKWYVRNFKRHLEACGKGKWCTVCLTHPDDLVSHRLVCEGDLFPCRVCSLVFQSRELRLEHETICRRPDSSATARNVRPRVETSETAEGSSLGNQTVTSITAIDGLFRKFSLSPPLDIGTDFQGALKMSFPRLTDIIERNHGTGIKFNLEINVMLSKMATGDTAVRTFDSEMIPLLLTDPIAPALQKLSNLICERIDKLIRDGSGWAVHEINCISINITR